MKKSLVKIAGAALLASWMAAGGGCMTYISQTRFWDPEGGKEAFTGLPRVYQNVYRNSFYNPVYIFGGTVNNVMFFDLENPPIITTCFILDFPFSLVADIVLLPLTIGEELWEQAYPSTEAPPEERKRRGDEY